MSYTSLSFSLGLSFPIWKAKLQTFLLLWVGETPGSKVFAKVSEEVAELRLDGSPGEG